MAEGDSQWQLKIKTEADLAALKATSTSIEDATKKTDDLTAATKRYNDAAEAAAARNAARARSNVAEYERVTAASNRAADAEAKNAKAIAAQEKDWGKRNEIDSFLNEGYERRRVLREKEAKEVADYNSKVIAEQQKLYNSLADQATKGDAAEGGSGGGGSGGGRGGSYLLRRLTGVGGLGVLGGFATAGLVVVGVLSKIVQGIKEMNDAIQTTTIEPMVDMWEDVRAKVKEVKLETDSYWQQLQRIINRPETEAERADRQRQAIARTAAYEEATMQRLHGLAMQRIDQEEQAGVISHQEGLRRKFQAEEEYQAKLTAQKNQAILDEFNSKKAQLETEQEQLKRTIPTLDAAQKTQQQTTGNLERERLKLDQEKKAREAARDLIRKTNEELNEVEDQIKANDAGLGAAVGQPGAAFDSAKSRAYNPLLYAKRAALTATARGANADLDAESGAIPRQQKIVDAAEEANRKATESVKYLQQQMDALAESINKLNIELPSLASAAAQKVAENENAAAQEKASRAAAAVSAQEAVEKKAGVAIGSPGSHLRYNPAQKRAWDALSPQQRAAAGDSALPGLEFDPTKIDPDTRHPVNPGQASRVPVYAPGAQAQYNTDRYGNAGAAPAASREQIVALLEREKTERDELNQALKSMASTNVAGMVATRAALAKHDSDISKITEELKNQSSRHYDTQVH